MVTAVACYGRRKRGLCAPKWPLLCCCRSGSAARCWSASSSSHRNRVLGGGLFQIQLVTGLAGYCSCVCDEVCWCACGRVSAATGFSVCLFSSVFLAAPETQCAAMKLRLKGRERGKGEGGQIRQVQGKRRAQGCEQKYTEQTEQQQKRQGHATAAACPRVLFSCFSRCGDRLGKLGQSYD